MENMEVFVSTQMFPPPWEERSTHSFKQVISLQCQTWPSSCISCLWLFPLNRLSQPHVHQAQHRWNYSSALKVCNALTTEPHWAVTPAKESPKSSFISLLIQLCSHTVPNNSPQQAKDQLHTNSIFILKFSKLVLLFEITTSHLPILQFPQATAFTHSTFSTHRVHTSTRPCWLWSPPAVIELLAASQGKDMGPQIAIPTEQAPYCSHLIFLKHL